MKLVKVFASVWEIAHDNCIQVLQWRMLRMEDLGNLIEIEATLLEYLKFHLLLFNVMQWHMLCGLHSTTKLCQ